MRHPSNHVGVERQLAIQWYSSSVYRMCCKQRQSRRPCIPAEATSSGTGVSQSRCRDHKRLSKSFAGIMAGVNRPSTSKTFAVLEAIKLDVKVSRFSKLFWN